jgi:hypothetical protein
MLEVHSGTKPGRPSVALLFSAIVLVAALGLAWVQVLQSHSLGPEQAVPHTPLLVRPPLRWVPDPSDSGSFVLPVLREARGQEYWEADRRIRFEFERWPAFQPLAEQLATEASGGFKPEPARIGPFAAVQLRQAVRRRWGRQTILRESILRVACLPGGQLVKVVYLPMTDLTLADLRLFDRVCAAIRFSDPTLDVPPAQAKQQAGVEFPLPAGSPVGLPHVADVPGLFVGGSEGGLPAWSLGIFRTWLAEGRTPRDLLNDFAMTGWLLADSADQVRQWQRGDGVTVATLRHPDPERNQHSVAAAWVVDRSPTQVVMLFVYTNEQHLAGAEAAAQRVAEQLDIRPLPAIPDLDSAQAAGVQLAALLTKKGALPWWGQRPTTLTYSGTTPRGEEVLTVQRAPISQDPERGYQGVLEHRLRNHTWVDRSLWTIDGHALGYTFKTTLHVGDGHPLTSTDNRSAASDVIRRTIDINEVRRWDGTFRPGPAFVCPPVESLAEAWVARQSEGVWLVDVATVFGHGSHTRLLRPLPPQSGNTRALVLDDYRPQGVLVAFDGNGESQYEVEPGARYERIR